MGHRMSTCTFLCHSYAMWLLCQWPRRDARQTAGTELRAHIILEEAVQLCQEGIVRGALPRGKHPCGDGLCCMSHLACSCSDRLDRLSSFFNAVLCGRACCTSCITIHAPLHLKYAQGRISESLGSFTITVLSGIQNVGEGYQKRDLTALCLMRHAVGLGCNRHASLQRPQQLFSWCWSHRRPGRIGDRLCGGGAGCAWRAKKQTCMPN